MLYYSLNNNSPKVTFKEAVKRGLAPDKGLYFPEKIDPLPKSFFDKINKLSQEEIAFEVIKQFVGDDMSSRELKTVIEETLCFDFPLVQMEEGLYSLELFHGPTMAFKDVGARFMARSLACLNKETKDANITVLVATSGDTGGAVASGFWKVDGVHVVILYPSGKVSSIQEKQLTTFGENITTIEVQGVFDDCQNMVKTAFLDEELAHKNLTSANSINVARWLPQMFYYFFAYQQLKERNNNLVFSVPSGNFGNVCAGVVAKQLGLPIKQFVASTNSNDIFTGYLNTGIYAPKSSKATISNAMDVGDPSNFPRIQRLYQDRLDLLRTDFVSYSFDDDQTREGLKELLKKYDYVADPHGAVAYLGAKAFREKQPNGNMIFLETAHPSKFLETVENTLGIKVTVPKQIASILDKPSSKQKISAYSDLKNCLLESI